jgi:hypothetical protein
MNMLTKQEQLLIISLHDDKKHKDKLSSFYSNERSLYKSALRLKKMDLMKYADAEFSLTFKGFILSTILFDIKKVEDLLIIKKGGIENVVEI